MPDSAVNSRTRAIRDSAGITGFVFIVVGVTAAWGWPSAAIVAGSMLLTGAVAGMVVSARRPRR
jgi:hypothetical protein